MSNNEADFMYNWIRKHSGSGRVKMDDVTTNDSGSNKNNKDNEKENNTNTNTQSNMGTLCKCTDTK